MIDERMAGAVEQCRELRLRDRHVDGIPDALAEWSRRRLHTRRDAVLRVPGRTAAPLPKLLDVIEGEVVAGEVEDTVEQHAGVASRQHEAIAVEPVRIRWIVLEMPLPQHVRERRQRIRTGSTAIASC